ncbi:hypothetical protein ACFOY4_01730 [Actinomadura syzygii]|uniref:Uncharacterized protein n=1 Tax=Actinomadura syzygii TaxID=1427538 RepID=A0A5D0TSX7_9ACTN|nr:hypothetical protein [Actinomadura syzygii]TYC08540.1 hypothetical protein FXF65_37215 [Actinomadura syzygii]
MKIAGLAMNEIWAHRVLREVGVETVRAEGAPAEIGVFVESVDLAHHGPEQRYRPYLHITGELRSVRPAEALPHGVKEVAFPPGSGERVDAFYEFDDEQLTRLTHKGYFSTGFVVPEKVTGLEWELPATVDALVLAPTGLGGGGEPDVPVVFVKVHDLGNLDIDLESSQYDLVEYFDDHSKAGLDRAEQLVDDRGLGARSGAISPLFGEDDLDAVRGAGTSVTPARETTSARDDLDARLQDVAAAVDDEEAQARAQLERTAGTPENLYRQRVASSFEAEPANEPSTAAPAPADEHDLDLGDQDRDEPAIDASNTKVSLEETTRQVTARAAELDHGEADGDRQY